MKSLGWDGTSNLSRRPKLLFPLHGNSYSIYIERARLQFKIDSSSPPKREEAMERLVGQVATY